MKTTIRYLLLFIGCLCCSCNSQPNNFDTEMAIVFDETDSLTTQYPTAEAITAPLELRDDPWQGIRIVLTYISDKDVNNSTVVSLPSENAWTGNSAIRRAQVHAFTAQLQRALTAMKPKGTCAHSIVFRTIAAQANRLTQSQVSHKLLLVYSDLNENSDVTFYNKHVLDTLRTRPKIIEERLNRSAPLTALNGVGVWFLYTPSTYTANNTYMTIANFYKHIFEQHGATIHISNKFQIL